MEFSVMISVLGLGILTSISPCPLATNIAALSLLGKEVKNKKVTLLSGLTYTLGRVVVYILLSAIIVTGLMKTVSISLFLQKYMNELLGPILILFGLVLVDSIEININAQISSPKIEKKAKSGNVLWAFVLGILFALSFCPVSAGIFFGALIPISIKYSSFIMYPSIFGVGTAIPLLLFLFLIVFAVKFIGNVYNKITKFEVWFRYLTGVLFIVVGLYYSLKYIYELFV